MFAETTYAGRASTLPAVSNLAGGWFNLFSAVSFKSQSVEWPTPAALYAALNSEFHFDFDPCPSVNVDGDGLAPLFVSWAGKRVFCNPPYGPTIHKWLERAAEAILAVYLLPARTDTRWFHELCLPLASDIRFIKGRLKFGGAKDNAPFPSMIVVFQMGSGIDQPSNSGVAETTCAIEGLGAVVTKPRNPLSY